MWWQAVEGIHVQYALDPTSTVSKSRFFLPYLLKSVGLVDENDMPILTIGIDF